MRQSGIQPTIYLHTETACCKALMLLKLVMLGGYDWVGVQLGYWKQNMCTQFCLGNSYK